MPFFGAYLRHRREHPCHSGAAASPKKTRCLPLTIQLPMYQRALRRGTAHRRCGCPTRLPVRSPRDPSPGRLDRRHGRSRGARVLRCQRNRRGVNIQYIHEPTERDTRRVLSKRGPCEQLRRASSSWCSTPTSSPPTAVRATLVDYFSRPVGRHGSGPLGSPQSRRLAAHVAAKRCSSTGTS